MKRWMITLTVLATLYVGSYLVISEAVGFELYRKPGEATSLEVGLRIVYRPLVVLDRHLWHTRSPSMNNN